MPSRPSNDSTDGLGVVSDKTDTMLPRFSCEKDSGAGRGGGLSDIWNGGLFGVRRGGLSDRETLLYGIGSAGLSDVGAGGLSGVGSDGLPDFGSGGLSDTGSDAPTDFEIDDFLIGSSGSSSDVCSSPGERLSGDKTGLSDVGVCTCFLDTGGCLCSTGVASSTCSA